MGINLFIVYLHSGFTLTKLTRDRGLYYYNYYPRKPAKFSPHEKKIILRVALIKNIS